MRFPKLSDLDREQRRVYAEAPNDGAILIVGAPGTGKTVMAFHRAHKLRELGQHPHVIMFGRVLMRYTSKRSEIAEAVPVSTMHRWVDGWWRRASGRFKAPRYQGTRFDINWPELCAHGVQSIGNGGVAKLDWGHLIIDEGQDFPSEMYVTLGVLAGAAAAKGLPTSITVFADDNQRLNVEQNSETPVIRSSLFISGDEKRNYTLKRNFRNSYEIARFAAYFQVGNASGEAELPDRKGELPRVLFCRDDKELADHIARKVRTSPGRQVGVIVAGSKKGVKRMHNQLASRLKAIKATVQAYINNDESRPAERLDFEVSDTVTVLHKASAKGLEFDIVFFVGLESMDLDASGGLNERMALYVMSSRARFELYLTFCDINSADPPPAILSLFPPPNVGLCGYDFVGNLEGDPSNLLAKVEWTPPLHNE